MSLAKQMSMAPREDEGTVPFVSDESSTPCVGCGRGGGGEVEERKRT